MAALSRAFTLAIRSSVDIIFNLFLQIATFFNLNNYYSHIILGIIKNVSFSTSPPLRLSVCLYGNLRKLEVLWYFSFITTLTYVLIENFCPCFVYNKMFLRTTIYTYIQPNYSQKVYFVSLIIYLVKLVTKILIFGNVSISHPKYLLSINKMHTQKVTL